VRLDEEKLEALRSWGERLLSSAGEESTAIGRAILMLVEEIDRLHIQLWHARIQPSGGIPVETDGCTEAEEEPVRVEPSRAATASASARPSSARGAVSN
jgi:hypothetical protein